MSYEQRARVDTPDGRRSSDADFVDGFVAVYVDHEPWKDAARKQLSERLASIAAEARGQAIEEAARIPEEQARNLEDVVRSNVVGADQVDQLWIDRLREEHEELCKMADAIRNLAPRPGLRLVAREDLAHATGTCGCAYSKCDHGGGLYGREHTAIINRLRAGEE